MSAEEALADLADLADRLRDRYFGKYQGTVTEVDATTLRLRAKVPSVLGTTPSGWCLPCVPYAGKDVGLFLVPDVGAAVWIEFEGGDVSKPIWVGCYWRDGELPADAAPKVRGLVTAAPHSLLFDDDAEEVTLTDSGGGSVALTSDGVTASRGGKSVVVADSSVSVNDGALEVS
ncbi:phage baseplate assembly protein V [Antribacter gilvus]|uniref:phage baseplate assembly protein V n=1 Tax=Antribacter gilvus TaxID=2304675 RepID=UPI000F775FBF|nr:phage baseplate assembly protein V [Antribacter gilvus]